MLNIINQKIEALSQEARHLLEQKEQIEVRLHQIAGAIMELDAIKRSIDDQSVV